MNHSTEPNEPDGAPEPELDARPDLETLPLTEAPAEETPALGVEEVSWGGPELVENVYAPLAEEYGHLQSGLEDDALGWTAQLDALRALRGGRVAGDWETLARLLVAPGTLEEPGALEETGAVRLVRTADEAETVRALIADLKAAGERTLLLAPTPEKAAELLDAVQEAPEILTLLIETQPPRPPAPPSAPPSVPPAPSVPPSVPPSAPPAPAPVRPAGSDETLKLPTLPDEPPAATSAEPTVPAEPTAPEAVQPQEEATAAPVRDDFGSHGTVEFKPVTGLPDPGAGVTRAEPLPGALADGMPEAGAADATRAEPLPALAEDDLQSSADATRAEALPGPLADGEQPAVPERPEPGASADVPISAEATAAHALPGRPGDDAGVPSGGASAPDSTETLALPVQAAEEESPGAAPAEAQHGEAGGRPDVPTGEGAAEATLSDAPEDVVWETGAHSEGAAPAEDGSALSGQAGEVYERMEGVSEAAEARAVGAALRAAGEGWPRAWRAEAGALRRGLMLLEQWPRDVEALAAVRADAAARKEALDAELARLASAIEEARDGAQSAEERAAEAEAEAERLVVVQREAEEELAGPRAEAERLQAIADAAGVEASELTRVADEAFARCMQLEQRAHEAQNELRDAQQVEASLKDELARAQAALPAAMEEADRLAAVDADASAEGHAAYYRLVSAESALAAVRRKMTLTQRLHVAAPPSNLRSVRAEVRARAREADEAAKRAQEAKDAAERAEAHRQGLATFVAESGPRLATAREAQERLTTELAWLATERETAGAEHQEQARRAAEAVDRATQAGLEARAAQQAARAIEERVEAARTGREEALAAMERARADTEAAVARAAEGRAELDRRGTEGQAETAAAEADVQAATETEARSREKVREVFGADPADDPEVFGEHRRAAMARIEELGGLLGGGEADGAALLPAADLVVGTPVGVGAAVPGERFGALVAVGVLDDADFLVGAVRAARWILVGPPGDEQPGHGTFARCAVAAPRLVEDGG